jgi:hypothetical protein
LSKERFTKGCAVNLHDAITKKTKKHKYINPNPQGRLMRREEL